MVVALLMRDRVADLRVDWLRCGFNLALGIGIGQGYATIGAIGFEGRIDYSAIGTVPNLAARLAGTTPRICGPAVTLDWQRVSASDGSRMGVCSAGRVQRRLFLGR